MRILTITSNHPPYHSGGYELRVKDIMDGLAARGYEVLVLSTKTQRRSRKSPEPSSYPVKRLLHNRYTAKFFPKEVLFDLIDTKIIENEIKDFRPDLIYLGHTYMLSKAILPFIANQNLPMVYDEGGSGLKGAWTERGRWFDFCGDYQSRYNILNKIKPLVINLVLLMGDGRIQPLWRWPEQMKVFFNSQSSLDHSLGFGVPVKNAEVIHSGVVLDKFPFKPRTKMSKPVRILCPGRLEPRKGQLDAIELISMLAAEGIQAVLTLVGETPSQSYMEQVKGAIKSKGLDGSVNILGMVRQSELSALYQQADVCFFSSHHPTGFSRTPFEAMASGCVVISFGGEGSKEIVEHGSTGFIFEEQDFSSIVNIIKELLSNPQAVSELIHRAHQQIERDFSSITYIDNIMDFLDTALQESAF